MSIGKHPTISSLIKESTTLKQVKQIHAHLLVNATLNNPSFHGQFLAAIALHNPTNLPYTTTTPLLRHPHNHPNLFALNHIIGAYSKGPTPHYSFHFYKHYILRNNLSPDSYTFNFMIRTCAHLLSHHSATCLHATVIKHGFDNHPYVQTGLIFMYAELGCLGSCYGVFRHVLRPDLVCQTAMLHACAKHGDADFARKLFDEMPHRDYIAWSAMVAGYVQCGRSREALELFREMELLLGIETGFIIFNRNYDIYKHTYTHSRCKYILFTTGGGGRMQGPPFSGCCLFFWD
ncbi:hypothetical protein PIB30_006781 [Stylosanthes scabra]|uniref:Pentatricopeptide repeat-containing protein n=1 Tax=Stylosanthes scabra TaxID=79078 RepID=A0ABU6U711_9FABA|nr:hypothetical protein [Stylosanthes scabra]